MNSKYEATELQKFFYWLTTVGDGHFDGANDRHANIDVADDIHLKFYGDPIATKKISSIVRMQ